MSATIKILLVFGFLLLICPVHTFGYSLPDEVKNQISDRLSGEVDPPVIWLGGALQLEDTLLPMFYSARQYAPAWLDEFGLTGQAEQLLALLRDSSRHGLCSDDFRLNFIEPLVQLERDSLKNGVLFDAHYLAILDLLLTDAFFRYALELAGGHPSKLKPQRLADALQQALNRDELKKVLTSLAPQQEGYHRLQQALLELRELSALGGWPQIHSGKTLRAGDRGQRVLQLKTRLFLGGDLEDADAWGEDGIGDLTESGVRHFQERHGLTPDGAAGPLTLAEMNVPIEDRIRQIELNMMRWRQSPIEFGERHIRVNVAAFTLEVHEQGEIVMAMPVVVGTPYRKTPMFSAQMSYLEFAPYWYVPGTILREDKLPKIRQDPGWLGRHNYEIISWREDPLQTLDPLKIDWAKVTSANFPGSLRMRPGPWNPLGRVKFMFPNRYAIYLHDTNERQLFSHEERLYSSGCIRIERPLDLAQYLLEGVEDWGCELIVSAMQGTETLKVRLPKKIPVHLLYWTAWVDDHDRLQFRRDIYLRDADLEVSRRQTTMQAGVQPMRLAATAAP